MLTPILNRETATPRDLSSRILSRLYPNQQIAAVPGMTQAAPKSPTGLPIYQPPPPAPVSGRMAMAQPATQTQSVAPAPAPVQQGSISALTNPQAQGNPMQVIQGFGQAHQPANPFSGLSPEYQKMLNDYFGSLAGIDYKGSHESALMQRAALAQLLGQWQAEGPVDYTSAAPMADQFDRSRGQLEASLAARGLNGGVVGGALSNSYSQEARGIGEYIRQLLAERQRQHHDDLSQFNQWARGLNAMGLGKNIDEQNSGGFWGDLLGVGGGILGKVL